MEKEGESSNVLGRTPHLEQSRILCILCRNINYFTCWGEKKEISCKVNLLLLFRVSSVLNPTRSFVKAERAKTRRIEVGLDFMLMYVKNVTIES